ncbi:MAG: hypothetical protein HDR46_06740 [Bacteroides sp.]|nr:hypothetical protein [Bacteroides sp.]MDE6222199.1 hypothetical protein [Muribaculaceae bacterium]
MESNKVLIPDNEGNHLVVVLSFYDDKDKVSTFQIPPEFDNLDIVDISIEKLDLDARLGVGALFRMCQWLLEEFMQSPNVVFSFICSTDPLTTNHKEIAPELYRWNLFEKLYQRNEVKLRALGIESKDVIVGAEGYQSYAKVFYRSAHAPIIHIVIAHLSGKYG